MPYVLGPLLALGAIHHILTAGWDWMDVAWLVVGIGSVVGSLLLEVYTVRERRRHSRWRMAAAASSAAGGEREP